MLFQRDVDVQWVCGREIEAEKRIGAGERSKKGGAGKWARKSAEARMILRRLDATCLKDV